MSDSPQGCMCEFCQTDGVTCPIVVEKAAERERADRAEADLRFYQERETDICKTLPGLSDGGKHRADIISRISFFVEGKERAEADNAALMEVLQAHYKSIIAWDLLNATNDNGDDLATDGQLAQIDYPSMPEIRAMVLKALSQPHPGDELRTRVADLEGALRDFLKHRCLGCPYRQSTGECYKACRERRLKEALNAGKE